MDDGTVSDYTPTQVADGTVDRDNQRAANEAAYGCYMTDAQIDRGDCDIPETLPIEYPDEEDVIIEVDDDEQKPERKTELPSDDDVVPTVVIDVEDTDTEGENKGEPLPPILPIEDLDIVDVPIIDLDDIEIPEDIIIVIPDDDKPEPKVEIEIIEEEEDELDEEVPGDDVEREEESKEEDEGPDPEPEEKTTEQIEQEVEVLEDVIEEVIAVSYTHLTLPTKA